MTYIVIDCLCREFVKWRQQYLSIVWERNALFTICNLKNNQNDVNLQQSCWCSLLILLLLFLDKTCNVHFFSWIWNFSWELGVVLHFPPFSRSINCTSAEWKLKWSEIGIFMRHCWEDRNDFRMFSWNKSK